MRSRQTARREIPYRPPRRVLEEKAGGAALFLRFFRDYVGEHRWRLALCMILVSLNGCSVFLMAAYGRYVVDHILVVRPRAAPAAGGGRRRIWAGERPLARQLSAPHTVAARDSRSGHAHRRPPGAARRLLLMFLAYAGTILALNTLARAANARRIVIGQTVCARLRDDLHAKVLELSVAAQRSHTSGRLLARITADVEAVQRQLMVAVLGAATSVSTILVGAVILLAAEWRIALLAFLITPLYALVWRQSRDPVRAITAELRHTNSCLYALVSQKLDATGAIQAYGRQRGERLDFHRLAACFLRDALTQQRLIAGVAQVSVVISALGSGAAFVLGARMVLAGQMTLGKMLYVYGCAASLFAPVLLLTQATVVFNRLLVILRRLMDILDEPLEIDESPAAVSCPSPLRHGIDVRHVEYSHGDDVPPVLRDVSLFAPAGRWVCITGPSGGGKTTLLHVLARLYEPGRGEVAYDGVSLSRLSRASLRQHVALVPQEAQIIRGSVRDNICYGRPEASPKQIMAAARAAELHELVMRMPVQYETLIGEKGVSLSGGQRQRLSLARALLTEPDVLLLDDCTSALDAATERRIQETLGRILHGRTAIIVSQRVSMAMRCDRVYVLADGVMAEVGTHEQLLARDGYYARLYRQQTEG